jgi:hypothetical protein
MPGKRIALVAAVLVAVSGGLFWYARNRQAAVPQYFTAVATEGPLRNVVNATGIVQTVVTVQVSCWPGSIPGTSRLRFRIPEPM